ncbi:MAG: hypothetical protein F6J94_10580 [Moorea sp. SIO1F2]|uniref:hypothetical protein n=1 Tax=Moorena sp. SIO1F2 TaxID=2607819 RepID=UPI0013BE1A99|nr:hypothetical protein [Moorena sp. SIO1F2]NET82364.1 hypothetical protein [Moorena sp. SIO1F2]
MSRPKPSPLLERRQGLQKGLIRQKTQTIHQTTSQCLRWIVKNVLLWMQLLSTGSFVVVWMLSFSAIEPAQATAIYKHTKFLEQLRTNQSNDSEQSISEESEEVAPISIVALGKLESQQETIPEPIKTQRSSAPRSNSTRKLDSAVPPHFLPQTEESAKPVAKRKLGSRQSRATPEALPTLLKTKESAQPSSYATRRKLPLSRLQQQKLAKRESTAKAVSAPLKTQSSATSRTASQKTVQKTVAAPIQPTAKPQPEEIAKVIPARPKGKKSALLSSNGRENGRENRTTLAQPTGNHQQRQSTKPKFRSPYARSRARAMPPFGKAKTSASLNITTSQPNLTTSKKVGSEIPELSQQPQKPGKLELKPGHRDGLPKSSRLNKTTKVSHRPNPEATSKLGSPVPESSELKHSKAANSKLVTQKKSADTKADTKVDQLALTPSPQKPLVSSSTLNLEKIDLTFTEFKLSQLLPYGSSSSLDLQGVVPANWSNCQNNIACNQLLPSLIPKLVPNSPNSSSNQQTTSQAKTEPLPVPTGPIPSNAGKLPNKFKQLPPSPPTLPEQLGQGTATPLFLNNYQNQSVGQLPVFPQTKTPAPLPALPNSMPLGSNTPNPNWGYFPYVRQTVLLMPMMPGVTGAMPLGTSMGTNNGLPAQLPYVPQTVILIPTAGFGMSTPQGINSYSPSYNPGLGQLPYLRTTPAPLPAPVNPIPMGGTTYNPGFGQLPYPRPMLAPLPAPVNPMPMRGSPYNSGLGQLPYLRNSPAPQSVVPINPIPIGGSSYGLGLGQLQYLNNIPGQVPGQVMAIPVVPNPNIPGLSQSPFPATPPGQVPGQFMPIPVVPNPNTPGFGQSPFPATPQPPLPGQVTPIPVVPNPNTPGFGQVPFLQPALQPWPPAPNSNLNRPTSPPTAQSTGRPLLPTTALTPASLRFQGSFVTQGENSVARARLDGNYVLTPQFLFGATLDLTSENDQLVDSPNEGATINQLFFTAAPASTLPTLRFSVGQLDLTSYFDRNSFAKDGVSHFFNPVFQTNPALSATAIASRPGLLVNWAVTDNIEGKVALFSSAESLERFDLNGLAGEIGLRYDNVIVRGTYASGRDGGANSGFREIFSIERGRDDFGINKNDDEEAFGVNGEVFIPELNMGIFGRYGIYRNRDLDEDGNTFSFGITFLDLFSKNDRVGLAYGRDLSNEELRQENGDDVPDVLELYYDFQFLPNVRLGFSLQQRNSFKETFAGFRLKTDFDVTPRGRFTP